MAVNFVSIRELIVVSILRMSNYLFVKNSVRANSDKFISEVEFYLPRVGEGIA